MFIQTENTPNPDSLKFIPGKTVSENSTYQFNTKKEAKISPLALDLFTIDGIKAVFLGKDFISVTKQPSTSWENIKTEILTLIMEHFVSGQPIVLANSTKTIEKSPSADEDAITIQIKELIETRIRPAVAQDGGDIIFHSFNNGIVRLELHGACSGCPSSTITLKDGIENMLKHYIPEVETVEAIPTEIY